MTTSANASPRRRLRAAVGERCARQDVPSEKHFPPARRGRPAATLSAREQRLPPGAGRRGAGARASTAGTTAASCRQRQLEHSRSRQPPAPYATVHPPVVHKAAKRLRVRQVPTRRSRRAAAAQKEWLRTIAECLLKEDGCRNGGGGEGQERKHSRHVATRGNRRRL